MTGASNREITIGRAFACDQALAEVVSARAQFRTYPSQATILAGGEPNDRVFLMIEGHARALAVSIDGRLVIVDDYHSGDLFGEASLAGTVTASEDVVARTNVEAGQFKSAAFVGLIENYGAVALAVSRALTRRLTNTTRRMVEGATLSAQGRIHAELLRAARAGEDLTIRPSPVLSEFALRVQSTRETCSRAINALEKKGVIRRDSSGLQILRPDELEALIY